MRSPIPIENPLAFSDGPYLNDAIDSINSEEKFDNYLNKVNQNSGNIEVAVCALLLNDDKTHSSIWLENFLNQHHSIEVLKPVAMGFLAACAINYNAKSNGKVSEPFQDLFKMVETLVNQQGDNLGGISLYMAHDMHNVFP